MIKVKYIQNSVTVEKELNVWIEEPLWKLRQEIEKELKVPIEAQKIIFAGKVLKKEDNNCRIVDLGLCKESTIFLVYENK